MSLLRANPEECWLFAGAINSSGYGVIWPNHRKSQLAHRVIYEHVVGLVPKGLHLDHLCRNRACINPAHLEPVTPRVNILRGDGLAAKNFTKTECKHGHYFSDSNTYIRFRRGIPTRDCRECHRIASLKYYYKVKGQATWPNTSI